ncbi:MAG: hypothetical protein LLG40_15445 [Deltaproteobacteria bacterium]|nr:hypothetical protein [Deltaproteobacteria bacterium]
MEVKAMFGVDKKMEKKRKEILSISFPSLILLAVCLKYFFFFCGGFEQLIAIPIFLLTTIYLAIKRIYLLKKHLTLASFKNAIISDFLFSMTVLFLPAFADSGYGIWPCRSIFQTQNTMVYLSLSVAAAIAFVISIILSRLSLINAE